ncbi:uncharacterized protein LOC132205740 [Neocloeon triangulifer]|uniref:uncharacterized protein LOC132205740 n=1 Tax=Neocloeon triangulifer TaxID=2078957 RepID=UPI00286F160C|nr:uncharacterized protein LOC132205740 [Neocloeon triangulifer]
MHKRNIKHPKNKMDSTKKTTSSSLLKANNNLNTTIYKDRASSSNTGGKMTMNRSSSKKRHDDYFGFEEEDEPPVKESKNSWESSSDDEKSCPENKATDALKTPFVKKMMDKKRQEMQGVVENYEEQIEKILEETCNKRLTNIVKIMEILKPVCTKILEDCMKIDEYSIKVTQMIELLQENTTMLQKMKFKHTKRVETFRQMLRELEKDVKNRDSNRDAVALYRKALKETLDRELDE